MEITEKTIERICDSYCRFGSINITQQELDEICEECPLNEIKRGKEERK